MDVTGRGLRFKVYGYYKERVYELYLMSAFSQRKIIFMWCTVEICLCGGGWVVVLQVSI